MLDLLLNEDESMIVDSLREYLTRELPIERLRPKAPPVDVARALSGMVELGWLGIGVPEDVGGAGLGLVEEMLIQRECGRQLVTPAVLANVLGAHVALQAGDKALARQLVGGEIWAALAVPATSQPAPDGTVYSFDWNEHGPLLLWTDTGMGLFDASALAAARPDECLDDSLRMHCGTLDSRHPLHWFGGGQAPLASRAQVLLAAAMTGLAEHACDLTVAYAKVREQYGKPIGTFQAVKHRCADMGIRARLAWYQTSLAALKVGANAPDAAVQAAAAKLVAAQAAHENGRAAIQLHGGIGFQSECDVHWLMKRSHIYDRAGGAMKALARRIVAELSLYS
jgi:alkylation response protein AidB-like acyl-CoA dehydrogenase